MKKALKDVLETLKPLGSFVSGVFSDSWNKILKTVLETLGSDIIPTVSKTFGNLWKNVLVSLKDFLVVAFKLAINTISGVLNSLLKNIVLPLADFLHNIEKYDIVC